MSCYFSQNDVRKVNLRLHKHIELRNINFCHTVIMSVKNFNDTRKLGLWTLLRFTIISRSEICQIEDVIYYCFDYIDSLNLNTNIFFK